MANGFIYVVATLTKTYRQRAIRNVPTEWRDRLYFGPCKRSMRPRMQPGDFVFGISPASTGPRRLVFGVEIIQTNLARISEAMKQFRGWATARGLSPSETAYVARAPARPPLRFSKGGDPTIERLYRTHWVSPALSEKKREQLEAKVNRPPELVVIQPLNGDWECHRCAATGDLLIMEPPGPACLACAGLASLQFLPSGDAGLTRKAKAASKVHAVVVQFSRSRGRYERQGLLVEPEALRAAQGELERQAPAR